MLRIAHIINPFNADPSSDLYTAQPITFASMVAAKESAENSVEVSLFTAQFLEDRDCVPSTFKLTQDLERSVMDQDNFQKKLKLPLIADILGRLYESSNADYFIYTNVDIGLYPDFYMKIKSFIDSGLDAFIINRRRLPDGFDTIESLKEIYTLKGKKHPGFDCFVFKRDLFPKFSLEGICIGVPFIGITLSQNIFAFSERYKIFTDEILTFHIGEEIYRKRAPKEYFKYNQKEFWKAMNNGPIKNLTPKKMPYGNWPLPLRTIRWGLHPSIPIRLGLKLEKRKLLNLFVKNK